MGHPPASLVTGASRGLGRGIAEALSAAGHSVAINYARNATAAADCAERCGQLATDSAQRFPCIQANVADPAQRQALLARTLDELGRLDALVNNAGIAPPVRADLTEATEESFQTVMETNLTGPYFLTQAVANHWLAKPQLDSALAAGPAIVFVTSVSASYASVNRGEYCISKAGLSMARQLWATRLTPHGINVYEVRPGLMATDMTAGVRQKYDALIADGLVPQGRWGTAADVGAAVTALIAGQFSFSAGAVIDVDGGFSLQRL